MRYFIMGVNGVRKEPPTVRICLLTAGGFRYLGATPEYLDIHVIGTVSDKGENTMGLPTLVPDGDAERCDLHFGWIMCDSGNDQWTFEADNDDEAFEKFREWCAQKKEAEQ